MPKHITYIDPDGKFRTITPGFQYLLEARGLDENQAVEYAWEKTVQSWGGKIAQDHPHFVVDADVYRERVREVCVDCFRYAGMPDEKGSRDALFGAWEMDAEGLPVLDMAKARGVQMNHIRFSRLQAFKKLDGLQVIATGKNDTVELARIEVEKQVLRDIPQTFDLTTPGNNAKELEAKWPDELPPKVKNMWAGE